MTTQNKIIIGAIAGAVLIALAVWKSKNNDKSQKVSAEVAAQRTIIETVTATGKIYPEEELKISSDVSGTLVDLLVEEGDSVRAGQLLARVNADVLQNAVERTVAAANSATSQVETQRAQLAQAMVNVENAKIVLDRQTQLFKDGVGSKAELDQATANYRSVDANLATIRENIKSAEYQAQSASATVREQKVNLARTNIYAPMSGVVSNLSRKKGEQVVGTIQMAGTEILRIANMNGLEVRVDVSESDILRVNVGDTADIEVDAYVGRKFKGIVKHISSSANNLDATAALTQDKVVNFTVKIHLLHESYADLLGSGKAPFRPGMSASADIRTRTVPNVLCVPIQAVATREQPDSIKNKAGYKADDEVREVVFVKPEGVDSVSIRDVKTGAQNSEYIEIVSGLKAGETVITGPFTAVSRKLKQGDKVKVVSKDELFKDEEAEKK